MPLKNEVALLHNYIALEEIRYGNRVKVSFIEDITNDSKIAPLILLTFLENAFKHGVSQELDTASIDLYIIGDVKDTSCIMVDDIVDTGKTMFEILLKVNDMNYLEQFY